MGCVSSPKQKPLWNRHNCFVVLPLHDLPPDSKSNPQIPIPKSYHHPQKALPDQQNLNQLFKTAHSNTTITTNSSNSFLKSHSNLPLHQYNNSSQNKIQGSRQRQTNQRIKQPDKAEEHQDDYIYLFDLPTAIDDLRIQIETKNKDQNTSIIQNEQKVLDQSIQKANQPQKNSDHTHKIIII